MKLHIYLFRHGQTYYNRDHFFTGWKDARLTPLGVRQAKKIAEKLRTKRIDVAYQTRLSRSKDTLKYVLKYHPECRDIIEDDRMIERSYGRLEGLSHTGFIQRVGKKAYDVIREGDVIDDLSREKREEVERLIGEDEFNIIHRSYHIPPPGGESVKMVEKRVRSFIKDMLKRMRKEKSNIAISAHGNSMRPFRRYFEHLTIKQMMKLENPWDNYFEYTITA